MSQSPSTLYAVEVTDDENSNEGLRLFATAEQAETYRAQWDAVPDRTARAYPIEVSTTVPRVVKTTTIGFTLYAYQNRGARWWEGDLSPETLRPMFEWRDEEYLTDEDNVPVRIQRTDDRIGSLIVTGTDEAAVRAAYVDQVREMLAAAGH